MRVRVVLLGLVAVVVVVSCAPPAVLDETLIEEVEFESLDFPGRLWDPFLPPLEDGSALTVTGELIVPPTDEPVPAVIMSHGCGGVGGSLWGWVDELNDLGIAVFIVEGFRARDITEICSGRETINVASPIVDAYRAADALDAHPWVDGSRLAVVGFSFGGRTAIWSAMSRFQEAYDGRAFAGHVAFYPSTCYIELADETVTSGPIRILVGTEDNWTPIEQCEVMAERMATDGADIEVLAYPGAEHSFDDIGLASSPRWGSTLAVSPRNCSFVEVDGAIIDPDTGDVPGVGSTCVERGITYAYDAAARQAAATDLAAFLTEVLQP